MIIKKEFHAKLLEDRGIEKILISLKDGNIMRGLIKPIRKIPEDSESEKNTIGIGED